MYNALNKRKLSTAPDQRAPKNTSYGELQHIPEDALRLINTLARGH